MSEEFTEENLKQEFYASFGDTRSAMGRNTNVVECGLSAASFGYWYLGYKSLGVTDRERTAFNFLDDSRSCLEVLFRRLITENVMRSPALTDELLDGYFDEAFTDKYSLLYGANFGLVNLIERFLSTTLDHPYGYDDLEPMPKTVNAERFALLLFIRNLVVTLCSESVAEAFMPEMVIKSAGGLDRYGETITQSFRVKTMWK